MAQQTLLDIAKLNGSDKIVGLIEENLNVAPEFALLPARTIRGISYKTVTRTSFPDVGFRFANESTTPGKSEFINKLVECYILSSIISVDKAVAMAYEDGVAAWQAIESSGVMAQSLIELGQQIIYGTLTTLGAVGNAKGFPGLLQSVDSTLVVDAGGTTADTASSVYAIRRGVKDVTVIVGNEGSLDLGDFREQIMPVNIPSFVADLTGWVGMQVGSKYSVGRIKKLTADSAKTLTDAMIADLVSRFPVGHKPDLLLMSRRSAFQLQTSRTVALYGVGSTVPSGNQMIFAPQPTESNGIPIVVTDSIVNTEALTL